MTTLGKQDPEHDAGPLLGSRYRLETLPPADHEAPVLVHGTDEVSARAVTLLLLPENSSMLERLALRSQVRRFTEIEHPAVARVIDVLDARPSLAVVLPHAPGARLLADGGGLPADGVTQLAGALRAVHALGRAHGALDEHAVLVLPDSTVQLLPLPPEAAALPEEDLRALEALAVRSASGGATGIPTQRTLRPQPAPGGLVHPGPGPWRASLAAAEPGTARWWPALTRYVADMNTAWHAFAAFARPQHPDLRVVFAMLAGGAPLHGERLAARGGPAHALADDRVFYDTSSYGERTIDAVVRCVGVDQLVYGSDRPVVEPLAACPLGLAAADAMVAANVARLLGDVRAAVAA